jgi:hypothetical protein
MFIQWPFAAKRAIIRAGAQRWLPSEAVIGQFVIGSEWTVHELKKVTWAS